jgi:hypothetical protein
LKLEGKKFLKGFGEALPELMMHWWRIQQSEVVVIS